MSGPVVTVVARIRAKQGLQQQVRQELEKLLAPTRAEPGCMNYDLHQSVEDDTLFVFHENWANVTDLHRHLAGPHIQRLIARTDELLAEPADLTLCKRIG